MAYLSDIKQDFKYLSRPRSKSTFQQFYLSKSKKIFFEKLTFKVKVDLLFCSSDYSVVVCWEAKTLQNR